MKVSYKWLQSYVPEKLPEPEEISRLLTFHSFEVEGFSPVGDDVLFDIAVLPNRAHDALSHWSIAWEIAALSGQRLSSFLKNDLTFAESNRALSVVVEDKETCPRYTGRIVEAVSVGQSPAWLVERLATIGQRSINAAVDAANYVMFGIGQPMHVFDADKIIGSTIFVRPAREGERITTLDNKDVALDPSVLVIADEKGPLAIAGIKGGKRAEVDASTRNIIIEAANFHGTTIRKTAKRLGIRTDASIRYEHDLSRHLVEPAMKYMTQLLLELSGTSDTKFGKVVDVSVGPEEKYAIAVTSRDVERLLGVSLSGNDIESILTQIGLEWKASEPEGYEVSVPPTRFDLRLKADIVEEIGRFYGYEKIPGIVIPSVAQPKPLKSYYYSEHIRTVLTKVGFSEIYGYSFAETGVVELKNPLAENRAYLRTALAPGLSERLLLNTRNKDILGLSDVLLFEIGTVYNVEGEEIHVSLASSNKKTKLAELLSWPYENMYKGTENIVEFSLSALLSKLPDPVSYAELGPAQFSDTSYTPFSPFPFSARDVAVFVPTDITADTVMKLIGEEKGKLCVRGPWLFDTFTKTFADGSQKTSYGFRLVFQATDRNLTGEEVQSTMDAIARSLNSNEGWQVR